MRHSRLFTTPLSGLEVFLGQHGPVYKDRNPFSFQAISGPQQGSNSQRIWSADTPLFDFNNDCLRIRIHASELETWREASSTSPLSLRLLAYAYGCFDSQSYSEL